MRLLNWFRWLFTAYRTPNTAADAVEALANSQAALTERLNVLTSLHVDLVQQVGSQNAAKDKQLNDLRAIVAQMGEQAKQKTAVARSMADIRRFTGDDI